MEGITGRIIESLKTRFGSKTGSRGGARGGIVKEGRKYTVKSADLQASDYDHAYGDGAFEELMRGTGLSRRDAARISGGRMLMYAPEIIEQAIATLKENSSVQLPWENKFKIGD